MAYDPSLWIGPYLLIAAKPEEVRTDMCKRPGSCVDPDPSKGRYCSGCGLDIGGMYVEPSGRTEGRYRYSMRVTKDARKIIAGMDGHDIDTFAPGMDVKPEFDPETKRFKDDGLKRFTIHPNRGNWGHVFQRRDAHIYDLTDFAIADVLHEFEDHFAAIIERLREEFDEVGTRFGVILTWS